DRSAPRNDVARSNDRRSAHEPERTIPHLYVDPPSIFLRHVIIIGASGWKRDLLRQKGAVIWCRNRSIRAKSFTSTWMHSMRPWNSAIIQSSGESLSPSAGRANAVWVRPGDCGHAKTGGV